MTLRKEGYTDGYQDGKSDGFQACYEIMRAGNCVWWSDCSWHFPTGCTHGEPENKSKPCPTDYLDCPLFAQTSTRPADMSAGSTQIPRPNDDDATNSQKDGKE